MTFQLLLLTVISEIFVITVTAQINLALEGHVSQSTTLVVNGVSYSANLAVEGPANNDWEDGCSSTFKERTAWWSLLLPKLAFITTIKIYYRSGKNKEMYRFRLYFSNLTYVGSEDDVLCYIYSDSGYPNVIQQKTCNIPTKTFFFVNRRSASTAVVELCYIEIFGCWRGYWGPNCTKSCPVECINQDCFPSNGSCVWGCDLQNCFHGKCNTNTNVCTEGCLNGRVGRYCTHYNLAFNVTARHGSSEESLPASLSIDGNTTSCISSISTNYYLQIDTGFLCVINMVYIALRDSADYIGTFRVYCSNSSDYLTGDTVIYNGEHLNDDIQVFAICRYITYVPSPVNGISKIELCEIEISGCPFEKYGDNCEFLCSTNCVGHCDLVTGNCSLGCLDGWTGNKCEQACNPGYFGGQCFRKCSKNCISPPCHHVAGDCKRGCLKGWKGSNCTEECTSGYFGVDCAGFCKGCFNLSCDILEGYCEFGCNEGFHGENCEIQVKNKDSNDKGYSVPELIGTFTGGVLFGFILTVIIFMRKEIVSIGTGKRNATEKNQGPDQQYDELGMENVSAYQDLSGPSNQNTYDQINTAYINTTLR